MDKRYNLNQIAAHSLPKPIRDDYCTLPIRAIKKINPSYLLGAARIGERGLTGLVMTISPKRYPRDIWVAESSHNKFSRASVKAAERALFDSPSRSNLIYGYRTIYIEKMAGDAEARKSTQKN